MNLYNAFTTEDTYTANGGLTNSTSGNPLVDLFFLIGSSRGQSISPTFSAARSMNPELAARILLWARDVRGGAGERQQFRELVLSLPDEILYRVIPKIPEVGRWDDLLVFLGTPQESLVIPMISKALKEGDGLCAKWMPRPNKPLGKGLWKKLGYKSPKHYRHHLVRLTEVVETPMCEKKWDTIDFSKITSLNHVNYSQAFYRNTQETYEAYKESLKKGEAKVNAGAVYPYDVIQLLIKGDKDVANAMWQALPDYLEGSNERILPLVDVSGSMWCPAGSSNVRCLDVAISLGLYISERVKGTFHNTFMTFESKPQMCMVSGSLKDRCEQMSRAPWGGSTDIQKAFKRILDCAVANHLPEHEMPTKLLILSDMEFNSWYCQDMETSAFKGMQRMYAMYGYKMPQVVFWNLNGRPGNVPVKISDTGSCAVSGFSPSIMKSLLGGEQFTPESIMMKTIMDKRYDF